MNIPNPTRWSELFEIAIQIIEAAGGKDVVRHWSFGGGTSLMLHIQHRMSHDIDIFIDNPQVLPLLNPCTQEFELSTLPSSYESDGTSALKIAFEGMGEIDFICCADITDNPSYRREVNGHSILIEHPGEVLAKKIAYRGARIQPRDIFDIVATIRRLGLEEIRPYLMQCSEDCATALATIQRQDADFTRLIISQLMDIHEDFADIAEVGREEAIRYLSYISEAD